MTMCPSRPASWAWCQRSKDQDLGSTPQTTATWSSGPEQGPRRTAYQPAFQRRSHSPTRTHGPQPTSTQPTVHATRTQGEQQRRASATAPSGDPRGYSSTAGKETEPRLRPDASIHWEMRG
eukprot:13325005-Heterocapsa_arctica.AAC.2